MQFSCDLCGRVIEHERYEATIEIAPAFDPDEILEEDLDQDNLQNIADALNALEDTGEFELEDTSPKRLRFDLCPHCAGRYIKNPLGRDPLRHLNFSRN